MKETEMHHAQIVVSARVLRRDSPQGTPSEVSKITAGIDTKSPNTYVPARQRNLALVKQELKIF